jgi:hypothetical protein
VSTAHPHTYRHAHTREDGPPSLPQHTGVGAPFRRPKALPPLVLGGPVPRPRHPFVLPLADGVWCLICLLCIFGRSSHPCAMSMLTHAPMTLNVLDQALNQTLYPTLHLPLNSTPNATQGESTLPPISSAQLLATRTHPPLCGHASLPFWRDGCRSSLPFLRTTYSTYGHWQRPVPLVLFRLADTTAWSARAKQVGCSVH